MPLLITVPGMLAGLLAALLIWRWRSHTVSRLALLRLVLAILLLGCFAGINALARARARSYVYPVHKPVEIRPEDFGISAYSEVRFPTPDGFELAGWFIPGTNGGRSGATVIVVHGYAGYRGSLLHEAVLLHEQGFGLLLYDARSCGESNGRLNSFGLYEVNDVRGAVAFLQAQPGVDPQRIGLMGHSAGGATAIMAAAQIPEIRAVAAESAYAGVESLLSSMVGASIVGPVVRSWGEYESGLDIGSVRPIEHVAKIAPRPLLLIHGERDRPVRVENAHQLYEAAGDPKQLLIVSKAGHDNLLEAGGSAYIQTLVDFFQKYLLEN